MPRASLKAQQLHASNVSTNIGEAIEARVKDPLWFLARQWQSGEFEAENGGSPVGIGIRSREFGFESVAVGDTVRALNRAAPLEAAVEAEEAQGDAPAWRAAALEYTFGLKAAGHAFSARRYGGRALDWQHFDYAGTVDDGEAEEVVLRVAPNRLHFAGAPHPRWWCLEEAHAYFDSPTDPEPNVLSLLLPEFFYTDINNWYTVPLEVRAGSLSEVTEVRVFDSFGISRLLQPATSDDPAADWALFALDGDAESGGRPLSGRFLFVPNIAVDILENDELEEVRFIRDEDANLVWAWERRITGASGRGEPTGHEPVGGPQGAPMIDGLPRFALKAPTARAWIPYVPRQIATGSADNGEIRLRRGRTDEQATAAAPQYRTRIVAEAATVNEEDVPITGVRVRRLAKFARGSDGEPYAWIGRDTETAQRTARPGLKFDYLLGERV